MGSSIPNLSNTVSFGHGIGNRIGCRFHTRMKVSFTHVGDVKPVKVKFRMHLAPSMGTTSNL